MGFIREIPNDLLTAFRATLEELREADLLIHLVDGTNPQREEHMKAVRDILSELAVDNIPQLLVFNKMDRIPREEEEQLREQYPGSVTISALQKDTLIRLTEVLERELWKEEE